MKEEYSIKDIQDVILSIVKDIDSFCRKNDITYYLMGGSALGAMRHKGFIPWDDDLDIFMTVENYEKFLCLFQREGNKDKYFLQRENTSEWPLFMSRVCLKGTTMVSDEFKFNFKQHHTVFVDIMCLYSAPSNDFAHRMQYIAAQMLRINALAICNFPNESVVKRMVLGVSKIAVNSVTRPMLIKYVHGYEGKNTELMGHYFGRARYKKTSFPRKYLGKPRYVPFENTELPVFEQVEEYLETRFGSKWMEMPSQETRDQYPIHGNFVDLKKDYTEYMNKERTKWLYE
ncbi:lipopolysaccharide cholinephosphotransferase [Clostridium pascui]|uniref:LicD family protein n=1 Tax=Clostridium pascui TaxID=46609 RepID=UPI00195BB83F|nr:LicD family protein [Clostridium pascui]MBM7869840.1 lipopolysaccharide cholinephosphotransferase [Clostridium pascui]